MDAGILAHGGAAGAAVEFAFVAVPIAIFALLSRLSRRRREREEAEAAAADETQAAPDADPEAPVP